MDKYIREKVSSCPRCIRRKSHIPIAPLSSLSSTAPMYLVCLDLLSLKGWRAGLRIYWWSQTISQDMPNRTRQPTKLLERQHVVWKVRCSLWIPFEIHGDHRGYFESHLIKELCQLAGMVKSRTTPCHAMGNGMVECFNQTLLKMLGTHGKDQKADWKSHVGPLVQAYNVTVLPRTGL